MGKYLSGTSSADGFVIINDSLGKIMSTKKYPTISPDFRVERHESKQQTLRRGFKYLGTTFTPIYAVIVVTLAYILAFHQGNSDGHLDYATMLIILGLSILITPFVSLAMLEIFNILMMIKCFWLQPFSFMRYHGCEHKVIALLESGLELNLVNLKKASKLSPLCGSTGGSLIAQFVIKYNFLLQYIFSTREPNEDQLQEGLEVAREYKQNV